jgi:hypothetical protein
MNIIEELNEVCKTHRIPHSHSDFQIANFIIGKETSTVAKQWQCLRELQARHETLVNLSDDLEEADENIQLAELDLQKLLKKLDSQKIHGISTKRLEIMISKKKRQIKRLDRTKKSVEVKKTDLLQEVKMFLEIFYALNKDNKFSEFNDPEAQLEYWNKKFETEMNINTFLGLPVSGDLIKSVMALPEISYFRKQVLDTLTNINKKLLQQSN